MKPHGLGDQFSEDDGEEKYEDYHVRKGNRKASHDRQEKKQLRKFAKYEQQG